MTTATARKIFVNLAVKDLAKSVAFFEGLGFSFNKQFTDESASMMNINEDAFAMLLTQDRFQGFTPKQLVDPKTHAEVLLALSAESREEVDSLVERALAAGGAPAGAAQDHGFMYGRSFLDLDGHTWEVLWMDPSHIES
jgi:predicted lactoylglutathione lyase